MKGSASSSHSENNVGNANSPPQSSGRDSLLMPSGMTTPSSNNILSRLQMDQLSLPSTSTPTSNTDLNVSISPPSSLLNQPTDNHLHHLSSAERMSMSLLSHQVRPMNVFYAPYPKVLWDDIGPRAIKSYFGNSQQLFVIFGFAVMKIIN